MQSAFKLGTNSEDEFKKQCEEIDKRLAAMNKRNRSFLRVGIHGEPKSGKSGVALDCLTEEEIKDGWKVIALDWDNGCEPTWRNNWGSSEHIIVFDPHCFNEDGSPNFAQSEKLAEAFVRRVKNGDFGDKYKFVFDGVDKWLVRCFDTLTKGKKETDFKFIPILYGKRNRHYNLLLDKVDALECDVFFITHMKDVYEGINNPNPVGKEADWHKSTPARFSHEIRMTKLKRGKNIEYTAEILSSKSNTLSVGKSFKVLEVNHQKNEVTWNGIPPLKEGTI